MRLKLLTFNIHKGYSLFNQRPILKELKNSLHLIHADIVFLQEAQGVHSGEMKWADGFSNQWEFLADEIWPEFAYGKNAIYENTHHGNAILSKYPIVESRHHALPSHAFEQRGYLEATIDLGSQKLMKLVNVHLGLLNTHRQKQIEFIHEANEDDETPSILAGDFNDWSMQAHPRLKAWGWCEGHEQIHGSLATSFPSLMPFLRLDRVYFRNSRILNAEVLRGKPWSKLSDHLPLMIEVEVV